MPPLLNAVSLTSGQFAFQVNGDAGPDYTILTSTNLAEWSSLVVSNSAVPPFFWIDTNVPNSMARFYRVVLGP